MHHDKYNYSNINYINNKTNIEIICKKHGSFWQRPSHHLNGIGCYKCRLKNETACREAIENLLKKPFPKKRPKFLQGLEYDMYNKEIKLAIEYDGIQHTKPLKIFGGEQAFKKLQENDKKKNKLSTYITLIRVPHTVSNFEKYFEDYFYFI